MVLVLVVGDAFVPQRVPDIPESFKKLFAPGRIGMVFVTGNVGCPQLLDYFRSISPKMYCTRGEYDSEWGGQSLKDCETVELEGLRFGLLHGHQVVPKGDREGLSIVARQLDIDVLVSGGTHIPSVSESEGCLFVNPGSVSGAFSPEKANVLPSFILLDVKAGQITSFVYHCVTTTGSAQEDIKIRKQEWKKVT